MKGDYDCQRKHSSVAKVDSRYQDGRKMWTTITTASRNLAQQVTLNILVFWYLLNFFVLKIWIHVPVDRSGFKGEVAKTTVLQNIIEKKTMINLVSHVLSSPNKDIMA